VHDAISYYYEHKNEIDREWKTEIKEADALRGKHISLLGKKVGKIKDIHR